MARLASGESEWDRAVGERPERYGVPMKIRRFAAGEEGMG